MNEEIINGRFICNKHKNYCGIIYLRTSPSGKHYIGQTLDERGRNYDWNYINGRYAGKKINKARKKYGPENFTYKVLFKVNSNNYHKIITILDQMEIYFISKYDSYKNGYNSTPGGHLIINLSQFKESEVIQLTRDCKFIKYWSTIREAAESIGVKPNAIHYCCMKKDGIITVKGYRWIYKLDYDIHKEDLLSFIQKSKANRSGIVQLSLNGEPIAFWKTGTEAAETLGISIYHISACCKGNRRQTGGYMWMFTEDYSLYGLREIDFENDKRSKKVIQFDLDGNPIKIWNSKKSAANELKFISSSSIKYCCLGRSTNAGGYMWMYLEDFNKLGVDKLDPVKPPLIRKRIVQCSLSGEFIKLWNSSSEINKQLGLGFNCESIRNACKGKNNNIYKGFIWKFEEEYLKQP